MRDSHAMTSTMPNETSFFLLNYQVAAKIPPTFPKHDAKHYIAFEKRRTKIHLTPIEDDDTAASVKIVRRG